MEEQPDGYPTDPNLREAGQDRASSGVTWTADGGTITARYGFMGGRVFHFWTGKPAPHKLHSLALARWRGWWRKFHKPANRLTRRYRG